MCLATCNTFGVLGLDGGASTGESGVMICCWLLYIIYDFMWPVWCDDRDSYLGAIACECIVILLFGVHCVRLCALRLIAHHWLPCSTVNWFCFEPIALPNERSCRLLPAQSAGELQEAKIETNEPNYATPAEGSLQRASAKLGALHSRSRIRCQILKCADLPTLTWILLQSNSEQPDALLQSPNHG